MSTPATSQAISPDPAKVQAFLGSFVADLGATLASANVIVGNRLGLYRGLAEGGPQTPAELAIRTGTEERYVREWLYGQAAGGYVSYDPAESRFSLTPEQAACLADEESPTFVPDALQMAASLYRDEEELVDAFRTGRAARWREHRFFRVGYASQLLEEWLPEVEGAGERLRAGASVAELGCGGGAATVALSEAYPRSRFVGFDHDGRSIAAAREAAERAGVAERVSFEVAAAAEYPGEGYDLVVMLDCLHDAANPVGVAEHVHGSLAEDGSWLLVEPFAGDRPEDNLGTVGRVYYCTSALICAAAHEAGDAGGAVLGAQAGERRLREVVAEGGFRRLRRVAETPFHLVLEARP